MSEVAPSPTINESKLNENLLQINVTPNPASSIINIQVFAKKNEEMFRSLFIIRMVNAYILKIRG